MDQNIRVAEFFSQSFSLQREKEINFHQDLFLGHLRSPMLLANNIRLCEWKCCKFIYLFFFLSPLLWWTKVRGLRIPNRVINSIYDKLNDDISWYTAFEGLKVKGNWKSRLRESVPDFTTGVHVRLSKAVKFVVREMDKQRMRTWRFDVAHPLLDGGIWGERDQLSSVRCISGSIKRATQ